MSGGRPESRCCSKNARNSSAHSGDRTPLTTSGRWFSRRSRTTSQRVPTAPISSFHAPKTSRLTRESTAAPAHMVQGSKVATSVHPSRRHDPRRAAALRRANTSACAVGSSSLSRWLRPSPMTDPDESSTTAPIGTSSSAADSRASRSARSKAASTAESGEVTSWSLRRRARGRRRTGRGTPSARPVVRRHRRETGRGHRTARP